MIVGIDFGTTNSGMAVYDGQDLQLLPIDPSSSNSRVARTALYVTNDQSVSIGRTAIDTYFKHNLGRSVRMIKISLGKIQVIYADLPPWTRHIYDWVDVGAPGRLFLSFKSGLPVVDYVGTVVGRFYYSLEDIIALYLFAAKTRAEKFLDAELTEIVLGRPVKFAQDGEQDALAQERLVNAAYRAGYSKVHLVYEPIAAAYHFERSIDREQNVLVFDFGGGTLDLTIMRLGDPRHREVLAVGGVPVAGDAFDQKLVRAKLPRHFGAGTSYGLKGHELQVPEWIYDTFSSWQTIMALQTPDNMALLREIARTARDKEKIEALISLVSSNYSLRMFDSVERAKQTLSHRDQTNILLTGPQFHVNQPVTRAEFEGILNDSLIAIKSELDNVLRASGLPPDRIDAVVRTGGSSHIPLFQKLLDQKFGREKVRSIDVFSSVTSGLGIIGYQIATGQIESKILESKYHARAVLNTRRGNVQQVDLDLLKRRLMAEGTSSASGFVEPSVALVVHRQDFSISVWEVPSDALVSGREVSSDEFQLEDSLPFRDVLAMGFDDPLLLVTTRHRFVLLTPRQIRSLRAQEVSLAAVAQLEPEEQVCAIAKWKTLSSYDRMIISTARGYAYWMRMDHTRRVIEGPNTVKLDRLVPGVTVSVFGADENDTFVAIDQRGRWLSVAVNSLSVQGNRIISLLPSEFLAAAFRVASEEQILVICTDGFARRLLGSVVTLPDNYGAKGKALVSRRTIQSVRCTNADTQLWAITNTRVVRLQPDRIVLDDAPAHHMQQLVPLNASEMLLGIIEFTLVECNL